ncbi:MULTISPECIES: hypothetical protein [unclassified Sphingomonas]|uniref:hypothetical protein n=1 Tax=unclassified Sphingomonas TaxID=196159 RepID=UPI0007010B8B|nr:MULTISPECIES: hypothetical protein [unclassified Sphingomonas]KQM28607.1 hypothetical protein ASE58_01660 [Sphingomonas sp. Leaf9]KQM45311.1 hypothetical protein ASE57_01655 [Sphingomonas sp. Leaf11]
MQQSAVAYFTNGRIILAAVSRTAAGDTIATDPKWFGKSVKKAVIAQAITEALSASRNNVTDPTPDQWKRQFIPFQDAAAVKNFKTFMRDTKRVDLERRDGAVILTPFDNLGVNNGFEARDSEVRKVAADDGESAAGALLILLGLRPDSSPSVASDAN